MALRIWIGIMLLNGLAMAQPGECLKAVLGEIPAATPASYDLLIGEALACAAGEEETLLNVYLDLGITFFRKGEGEWARRCLDSLIRRAPEGHVTLAPAWRVKALTYEQEGDFYRAEAPYLEAIAAYSGKEGTASPLAACCKSLGNLYTRFGDYEQGAFFLRQALYHYREAKAHPTRLAQAWVDLGEAYAWQDSLHPALACYDSALALPGTSLLELGLAGLAAGRVKGLIGAHQEARFLMQAALKAFREASLPAYEAECWQGLGELDTELGRYTEARGHLLHALAVNSQAYSNPHRRERARILLSLGNLCLREEHWQEGLAFFQKALWTVLPGYTDTLDLGSNPPAHTFYKENTLLQALEGKMAAWQMGYRLQQDTAFLHRLLASYEALIGIEDLLRFSYDYSSSKLMLAKASHQRAEMGIEAAYELLQASRDVRYQDKILAFAERSKAAVLLEELRHLQGIESALPEAARRLLDQEETHLSELKQQAGISDSLRRQIALQQQRVLHLIDSLERSYPEYYRFKYTVTLPGEGELRKALAPGQGLLEYFWGERALYEIGMGQDGLHIARMPNPSPAALDSLMRGLTGRWLDTGPLRQSPGWYDSLLARQAWQWSQSLWKPLEADLPEEVVVVPDGPLGVLPFDILLSAPLQPGSSYREWPFLLFSRTFSYAYSATWLLQLKKEKQKQARGWLAVAPLRWEDPQLAPLPWGAAEAQALAGLGGKGVMLLGGQAQKEAFTGRVTTRNQPYQVLHFNTHARAYPEHPSASWIAFSDSGEVESPFMMLSEVYQLRIPAGLVVLSACETGSGQVLEGEGIMSLARGFAFAGSKGVLSTLWPLRDRPASWIIQDFYPRLAQGQDRHQALRQSRIAFLQSEDFSEAEGHPYFWAAWVLAGETGPLRKTRYWPWLLGGAVLLLAAGGIWKTVESRKSRR